MIPVDHADEIANVRMSQMQREARELWRPTRDDQMAAIEILLASSIPTELRTALRERELTLSIRRAA
ncbi:hypothetical protein ABMA46_10090 [Mesorhizobium sp. CN5-321]|uniref:hypothetical protein n=1 Tax=Mesorhizobium hunchu TaxID=3157708 RepID=UPI0032B76ED0